MTNNSRNIMTRVQKMIISESEAGQRIDNFLMRKFKDLPRSKIYKIIRKGEVRVSGCRKQPSYKIKTNDELRIPPLSIAQKSKPNLPVHKTNIESYIIFEDQDFIVIDKPSGLAVHGGSGISAGVIEQLRSLKSNEKDLALVHRIDKETSGCLLISKRRSVLRDIHEKFRNGEVNKNYFAIVMGTWDYFKKSIDLPLMTHHRKNGERHVTPDSRGKKAKTNVKLINQYKKFALIQCQPITGRTHQLRVHLCEIGYPIYGDKKYINDQDSTDRKGAKRLYLHAQSLSFVDRNGNDRIFSSPMPPEFNIF